MQIIQWKGLKPTELNNLHKLYSVQKLHPTKHQRRNSAAKPYCSEKKERKNERKKEKSVLLSPLRGTLLDGDAWILEGTL